jgi:polysaccharide export outer membrane protein
MTRDSRSSLRFGNPARAVLAALIAAGALALLTLSGCAATSEPGSTAVAQVRSQADTYALNRQLASAAAMRAATTRQYTQEEYRVGPGDVLDIAVFQVEELNRKARVSGSGTLILPLLGEVPVGGKTVAEVERMLAEELGRTFLRDPQVSVFVEEYRSQQITVMGAVEKPGVFNVYRPRNVFEMLSEAGGLTEDAGSKVYVQTVGIDAQTGQPTQDAIIIDLKQVLESSDPTLNVVLRGGDTVHVPRGGTVFVEGAVRKPGAYQMRGEVNVLKAIALAGGTQFEAREGEIQVFRQETGDKQVIDIDLKGIRDGRVPDVALRDGDIVIVKSDLIKRGFAGFWRGFTGIFSLGKSI